VQVESFQQRPAGQDRISFTFVVSHKGNGAVQSPSGQLCSKEFTDKNKVKVSVTAGSGTVTCNALGDNGEIRLDGGRRAIECFLGIQTGGTTFETPVNIELSFNYQTHQDTTLLVKHFG